MKPADIKKYAIEQRDLAIAQGDAPLYAGGLEEGVILGATWMAQSKEVKESFYEVERLREENEKIKGFSDIRKDMIDFYASQADMLRKDAERLREENASLREAVKRLSETALKRNR